MTVSANVKWTLKMTSWETIWNHSIPTLYVKSNGVLLSELVKPNKNQPKKNLHHFSCQETIPFQQQGLPINSLVCLTSIIQTPRAPKVDNVWNLREFWDFWALESACLLQVAKDCNQYLTALKLKNECTYTYVYEWFHSVLTRGANSSLPCKAERRFKGADVYIVYIYIYTYGWMKIHPAVQPLTCFFSEKQGLKPIYSLTTASPSFLKKFQSTKTATANCATHLLLAILKQMAKSTKLLSLLIGSGIRQMELLLQRYWITLRNCWNIGWPCHSIHGLLPYF